MFWSSCPGNLGFSQLSCVLLYLNEIPVLHFINTGRYVLLPIFMRPPKPVIHMADFFFLYRIFSLVVVKYNNCHFNHFSVSTLVALSTVPMMYSCHHSLFPELFVVPNKPPSPLNNSSSFLSLLSTWHPLFYFLSLWTRLFSVLHTSEIIQYSSFLCV